MRDMRQTVLTAPPVVDDEGDLVSEYNRTMTERMGWQRSRQGLNPYEYHPEKGEVVGCCGARKRSIAWKVTLRPSAAAVVRLEAASLDSSFRVAWFRAPGLARVLRTGPWALVTVCHALPWCRLPPCVPRRRCVGMYYHWITPRLVLGSQPRSAGDVDALRAAGVDAILNLQQDRDMRHWRVDFSAIARRVHENGMHLLRSPLVDFDPASLRRGLAETVAILRHALDRGLTVYVHCTAGLGRAPGVVIAALHWFGPGDSASGAARPDLSVLDDAYACVTAIRPCGPNKVRDGLRVWVGVWGGGEREGGEERRDAAQRVRFQVHATLDAEQMAVQVPRV